MKTTSPKVDYQQLLLTQARTETKTNYNLTRKKGGKWGWSFDEEKKEANPGMKMILAYLENVN